MSKGEAKPLDFVGDACFDELPEFDSVVIIGALLPIYWMYVALFRLPLLSPERSDRFKEVFWTF